VSSAYYKLITPSGDREFMKSLIYPPLAALTSFLENTSITKLNDKGERGSPYLRPLPVLK
jgi:hypothetical protein